jgi:hypothetical protein
MGAAGVAGTGKPAARATKQRAMPFGCGSLSIYEFPESDEEDWDLMLSTN